MNENTYKICLRLTPQERAKLEADTKRCGLTKSALLRRMISGLEVKARPSQEIRELRTEIHRIGNNINRALVRAIANPTRQSESKTLILCVIH